MKFSVAFFGNEPLPKLLDYAELAETLGFEGVWFTDTQLVCREVYVTLAACAGRTKHVSLGTGVTMPHTRHESITASAFASLNEIAEGRVQLGISTGDNGLRTIGRPKARIADLETYVGQLRKLLAGQSVDFEAGAHGGITWLEKATGIPIHIAASGPKLSHAAARVGDGIILCKPLTHAYMTETVNDAKRVARDGHAGENLRVMTWIQTSVGHDRVKARRHAQGLVAEVLQMCHINMFDESDREEVRAVKRSYDFYEQNLAYGGEKAPIPERFIDMFSLAGDAAEARERVQMLLEIDGLEEIIIAPQHLEGSDGPSVEEVMRTVAEGVMAHIV